MQRKSSNIVDSGQAKTTSTKSPGEPNHKSIHPGSRHTDLAICIDEQQYVEEQQLMILIARIYRRAQDRGHPTSDTRSRHPAQVALTIPTSFFRIMSRMARLLLATLFLFDVGNHHGRHH